MAPRRHWRWLQVLAVWACGVVLIGGCPVASGGGSSNDSDQTDAGEQPDPREVTRSLDNTPPTAEAGPNQIVTAGGPVVLSGTGSSDADSDRLSYEWVQVAGTPTIEFTRGRYAAIAEFEAPSDVTRTTTLVFRLVVRDGFASDTDDVRVTIKPAG